MSWLVCDLLNVRYPLGCNCIGLSSLVKQTFTIELYFSSWQPFLKVSVSLMVKEYRFLTLKIPAATFQFHVENCGPSFKREVCVG